MAYKKNEQVGLDVKRAPNNVKSSDYKKLTGFYQNLTETFIKYLILHKIPLKDIGHDPSIVLQKLDHYFSHEGDFQALESYLKSLQADLGNHYRAYLSAICDFVQSRDCPFDNRYHSKTYFFNDIRITHTGKKLTTFNTQIKELITASPLQTARTSDSYSLLEGAMTLLGFGFVAIGYILSSKVENRSSNLTTINPKWMAPLFLNFIPMTRAVDTPYGQTPTDTILETEITAYPKSSITELASTESSAATHSESTLQNWQHKKINQPDPLHPWSSLFFPPDEVVEYMPSPVLKTDDDLEYQAWLRISGSPQAKKDIAQHIARIKNSYPLQVQEYTTMLLQSMPNFQIEPAASEMLIKYYSADAQYDAVQKQIQIAYPIHDEQTSMSYFVHEASHTFDHFKHIVLSHNENNLSVQPFFPDTVKEQAFYRRLWKKGDDRLEKMFPLINRLFTLKNLPSHNTRALQEIQQLQADLQPFISKGIDASLPYIADLDAPVETLKSLKAKGIKLKVGKTINLDGIIRYDPLLQVNGKVKILEYNLQPDGSAQFKFKILDNFIRILRHHFNIIYLLTKFSAERQDTERLAYIRMYLPGNIVETLWPEVYGYLGKQQAKIKNTLSNHPEFQIDTASIQRSSRIADQLQKLLSSKETVLPTHHIDSIHLQYGILLIEANRLLEAEKVLLNLISRKISIATGQEGLGQIYFSKGDFEKSVHYFTSTQLSDDLSRYCYSESLLQLGRYKEARESFDSLLHGIYKHSHYAWIQQIIPKRIAKSIELEKSDQISPMTLRI